jgi:cobalt-zinc-cadmium efflux system outer membrane protein
MSCRPRILLGIFAAAGCWAQGQQSWTESEIVQRFLTQSAQALELRAGVALAEAEARTRTVYANPTVSYSREGAGYNEFFEASQTLPLNGRLRYLRDAGSAAVAVADTNREAALWSLRSDLRAAFYRMLTAQGRAKLLANASRDLEQIIAILRQREDAGEASRYDRIRAEREASDLRVEGIATDSMIAAVGARLAGFLPEGSQVRAVNGVLVVGQQPLSNEVLRTRALTARAEYRAEQRALTRFQLEEQAARRLRIPDPQVSGGVKRADVISGVAPEPFANATRTGVVFSLTVPLPVFNNGHYEVARYQAEQEQSRARAAGLARRIQTEVEGASAVLAIRREALAAYQRELESAGAELTRITRVAYDEGEVGILELLDSLRVNRKANLQLLDLQASVREAWIELERVVGQELTGNEGQHP